MRGNMDSLPKWAKQEIERLDRDLKYAHDKLSVGPEDSDTFADTYSETLRPLGKGTSISFKFGEHWGQKFIARLEGDKLYVSGGSGLAVLPRSSNVVELKVADV